MPVISIVCSDISACTISAKFFGWILYTGWAKKWTPSFSLLWC